MFNIDNILNLLYKYKIITIFAIVISTSLMHGLNIWQYTIYNFDPLYMKNNMQNFILDPIIQMNNNGAIVLNYFNTIFQSFLQIPLLYIVSSVAIKSLIILFIYLIINKLINNQRLSFTIALFFILSVGYATHGVVLNGFWNGPIFFRASVSGLMTLIGLYFILKDKYYIAIIPFILSIHLHVLYGVTSFAFIFTSFIAYILIFNSKKYLKDFLILLILVGISILPILLGIDSSTFNTQDSNISQWYSYVFSTDPDDMSMLYFLGTEGYFVAPFLMLSIYFIFINKDKNKIDFLFIGSFILLLIILLIEFLHYNSMFFGGLSENFIGIQFRRGIWILLLFSAIINFTNIERMMTKENNNKILFLLIVSSFLYLFPNIIVLYIALFVTLIYFKKIKVIYLIAVSILFLYLGTILDFYQPHKLFKSLAFIAVASSFIYTLVYYKKITRKNILISIIAFFVFATSLIGLAKSKITDDLNIIAKNGILSSLDILDLEKKIYQKQDKIINNNIISYIRNNNSKKEFLLESMDNLYYGDAIIYDCPIFISRGNIAMPMFSQLYYQFLLYKLDIFNIDENELHSSKDDTLKLIDYQISQLSKSKMELLFDKYNIKFLITKHNFNYMTPVIKENKYYLYDLEMLR